MQASLNIDLLHHDCFSDIVEVTQESSLSPLVTSSHDLLHCNYSSIICVTHDFVDPCGFVHISQESVQDLSLPEIIDHNSFALARSHVSCPFGAVFPLSSMDSVVHIVECDTNSVSHTLVNFNPTYAVFLHDCLGHF